MRHWLLFGLLLVCSLLAMPWLTLPLQGICLLVMALVLWTLRPLPELHSALLIPLIALVLGLIPISAIASIVTNPMLMVFLFGFAFAAISRKHALDKLVMVAINRFAKGSEQTACWMVFAATMLISCWTSNVVTTALMLPLGLILAGTNAIQKQHFYALGIVFSATIGGMITPVGSSASLIASNLIGFDIVTWIKLAGPVALLLWLATITLLLRLHKPSFQQALPSEPLRSNPRQWLSLSVVITTLSSYVVASIWWRDSGIWLGFIPLFGLATFLITRLLKPAEIVESIKLRVLLIFVSAFTLGHVLIQTGADQLLLQELTPQLEPLPFAAQIALLLFIIAITTELMSNVACTAIMAPLFMVLLVPQGAAIEVIGLLVGIGCCASFVLPTATPANNLAIGVGAVSSEQLRYSGGRVKLLAFTLLWLILVLLQGYMAKL